MPSKIHELVQIYCGITLVSASAERTCSVMRRIKTSLKRTMTDNSLNNRTFANINKNFFDNINLQAVASDFAKARKTQINYFELH